MIRAISFDLFDTLVDLRWSKVPRMRHGERELPAAMRDMHASVAEREPIDFEVFLEAMQASRKAFGESHLREDREVSTGDLMRDLLRRIGVDEESLAERLVRTHMQAIRMGVEVLGHHREVLLALGRDMRLGICSNFTHSETALAVVDEAGLTDTLLPDALVVSDAVGWRKPHSRIFEAVSAGLRALPNEILHVGDSLRADVAGAAGFGMQTAWITRRVDDPDRALAKHEGPKPDYVISDLAELPALVQGLR